MFKKYFIVLDYHLNKIGIAARRVTFEERVFEIVTLVRILTFIFVSGKQKTNLGCLFIVCYKPVSNLIDTFRLYSKLNDYSKGSETKKLKYSGLQDTNPYEDLNKRVRETLDEPVVEGIWWRKLTILLSIRILSIGDNTFLQFQNNSKI